MADHSLIADDQTCPDCGKPNATYCRAIKPRVGTQAFRDAQQLFLEGLLRAWVNAPNNPRLQLAFLIGWFNMPISLSEERPISINYYWEE